MAEAQAKPLRRFRPDTPQRRGPTRSSRVRLTRISSPFAAAPKDPAPASVPLVYCSSCRAGIQRLAGPGSRFVYRLPNGKRADPETVRRIETLAIPPAWTQVWISPSENSHIQATGRDARGRKQYRYHAAWRARRDRSKFGRLADFAFALPRVRRLVRRHLRLPGVVREKVLATVVRLLDTTLIRVGNPEYARQNRSYGLTTMRNHHARVCGSKIQFSFRGKSGKQHLISLNDARLARILRHCQELPGQELFGYLDATGNPQDIGSKDVNDYLRQAAGEEFSAKDFRTWHGTVRAVAALRRFGPAINPAHARRTIVRVVRQVAGELGNTPAVCRNSYIHPGVLDVYTRQRALPEPARRPRALSADERLALGFLRAARNAPRSFPRAPMRRGHRLRLR